MKPPRGPPLGGFLGLITIVNFGKKLRLIYNDLDGKMGLERHFGVKNIIFLSKKLLVLIFFCNFAICKPLLFLVTADVVTVMASGLTLKTEYSDSDISK